MKIKLNWGFGVVVAFVAFISFIMYFIVNMTTNKKYDYDLVTEDYYKEELAYQKEINKEKVTNMLGMQVLAEKTTDGLKIQFPPLLNPKEISGTMFLYRPSDKQQDFEIPISLSDSHLLIPNNRLKDGRWNIQIEWSYNGQEFLTKKQLVF
ncbi:hypothetical protein SAMN05216480_101804 [Pustulibacterium marinum]|uniref:FixH protein n=1 Tax=Pustulibacterium marinum TaxID=1224947 RepID=A0A1I7FB05_9FLAO|nr:FixH family protein [Pustulibacterium marinum]SFU33331.1 hypothetical protein SAMN05216480_101804 [Pustulibacterium marinum]